MGNFYPEKRKQCNVGYSYNCKSKMSNVKKHSWGFSKISLCLLRIEIFRISNRILCCALIHRNAFNLEYCEQTVLSDYAIRDTPFTHSRFAIAKNTIFVVGQRDQ